MKRRPRNKIWLYFKEYYTHENTLICIEPDGKIYRLAHYIFNNTVEILAPCYGSHPKDHFYDESALLHCYKKFPSRRLAEKAMLKYNKKHKFKVTYVGAI